MQRAKITPLYSSLSDRARLCLKKRKENANIQCNFKILRPDTAAHACSRSTLGGQSESIETSLGSIVKPSLHETKKPSLKYLHGGVAQHHVFPGNLPGDVATFPPRIATPFFLGLWGRQNNSPTTKDTHTHILTQNLCACEITCQRGMNVADKIKVASQRTCDRDILLDCPGRRNVVSASL